MNEPNVKLNHYVMNEWFHVTIQPEWINTYKNNLNTFILELSRMTGRSVRKAGADWDQIFVSNIPFLEVCWSIGRVSMRFDCNPAVFGLDMTIQAVANSIITTDIIARYDDILEVKEFPRARLYTDYTNVEIRTGDPIQAWDELFPDEPQMDIESFLRIDELVRVILEVIQISRDRHFPELEVIFKADKIIPENNFKIIDIFFGPIEIAIYSGRYKSICYVNPRPKMLPDDVDHAKPMEFAEEVFTWLRSIYNV